MNMKNIVTYLTILFDMHDFKFNCLNTNNNNQNQDTF